MNVKVFMRLKKETKGTRVFEEINADGTERDAALCSIPSLYIRKSALISKVKNITVTVISEGE